MRVLLSLLGYSGGVNTSIVDNPKAPRIVKLAQLAKKKQRHQSGRFLVEGPQAVRELLRHRPNEAQEVFIQLPGEGDIEIEQLANTHGVPVYRASREVIRALSDTVTPQGVIAVATMAATPMHEALKEARLVVVLHEIRDPGNAGTVLRAADAAGADAVIFAGESIDPWNPKVVRSTTGSLFHVPMVVGVSLSEAVQALRKQEITPVAADVRGEDLHPNDPLLKHSLAWVFGNEARGLTAGERKLIGEARRLPIFGEAESLNLATAASVCLYTSAFARRG